jgi:tetratricopeptide (TPR) repeat protein
MLEDKLNIAVILGNISLVKLDQLEFKTAINRASESLKIREEFDDFYGLGIINNILGNIYFKNGKFNKAKHHYHQSLKYKENINDRVGIVVTMNNLGNIDIHNTQNNKAIEKFNSSLEISKEIGYYLGTCEALENLANSYSNMGDIEKSHNLIERSLKTRYEIGCEKGIEKTLNKMDLIKSGNTEINVELKSSPVHNNLFPSKGIIKISKTRESGKINFSLVNNLIDDINKFVKNYND